MMSQRKRVGSKSTLDKLNKVCYNTNRKEVKTMSAEMLMAYEEYCVDCRCEGKTPVSIWAWMGGEE